MKTEGGHKRGHSNMTHWDHTEEINVRTFHLGLVGGIMNVPYPMFITSRLEAGLKIDGRAYGAKTSGTVSVFELGGGDFGYRIEDEKGKTLEVVKGGQGIMHCPIVDDYGEPMRALLDFLTAAAESYHYEGGLGENATLFKRKTVEWAWQHSDELEMARWELELPPIGR